MTQIQFKKKQVVVAVCPVCGETLMGNNSHYSPYECKKCNCEWKADRSDPSNFTMIKKSDCPMICSHCGEKH